MLIGRAEETAELKTLLDKVRGGMSGAVLLRGEAGIGKTALLNAAVDVAEDLSVIRLEGIESEMQLGYAALHRLLLPYLSWLDALPQPQSDALRSAFGLTTLAPADRFMVSLAALSLLADVAKKGPLLIVVDDAQWLDPESVAALVFVARRLHADRIGFAFAVRDSFEIGDVFHGVAELRISGLDEDSARTLLTSSISDRVSYQVASRIIDVTRGNPLALLELSSELTSEHLVQRSPLPDPLPIGELIEARFLRQIRVLPVESQTMLLVAAADPHGELSTLRRVAEVLGLSNTAIESAADEGLLVLDPRVGFRHPLVRSAVYGGATAAERRRVHHALASVMDAEQDPDRKAMHMALGAVGPDEELAYALEQSAAQARARGGYVAESSFLVRSANLSPDPLQRAGRLLSAARASYLAGNYGHSESLLHETQPQLVDPIERAQAQRLDGRLRVNLGQPHLAPALLLRAAKAFGSIDSDLSHHSLLEGLLAHGASAPLTEESTGIEIAETALDSLAAQSTPITPADTLLKGVALRYSGHYVDAVPAMREAVRAQMTMSFEEVNQWTSLAAILAAEVWDDVEYQGTLRRLETTARTQGALYALQVAIAGIASLETRAGRFAEARERYAELRDVARAVGYYEEFFALFDVDVLSWLGDAGTRTKVAQLTEAAIVLHAGGLHHHANLSLSILELAEGNYEAALVAVLPVAQVDSPGWGCQALPIVVEAAVRCGNREAAAVALATLTDRTIASGSSWALGLLARCRALVADSSSAGELYEEALDHLGQTLWPTEVARTYLLYGEWLRRQKRRAEARQQLRQAYEMFDTMGARPFAERARVELLATGEHARSRRPETELDLTSRELQVARLAAQRATNREIAGQLFISATTVDYHLRKVFLKLGVTSRRDLVDFLPDGDGQSA